jgi:hypothetical protein
LILTLAIVAPPKLTQKQMREIAFSEKNPVRLPPKSVNLGLFRDGTYNEANINGSWSARQGD